MARLLFQTCGFGAKSSSSLKIGERFTVQRHLDLANHALHLSLDLEVHRAQGHLDLTYHPLPNLLVWTYQLRMFQSLSTTMATMNLRTMSQNLHIVNLLQFHILKKLRQRDHVGLTTTSNGSNNLNEMLPKSLMSLMFLLLFKRPKRPFRSLSISPLNLTVNGNSLSETLCFS